MLVSFENLPDTARVWVYTASRILSKEEMKLVSESLSHFMETWQSHGKEVRASFQLFENRFVIIAADEQYNELSGCGIDKSLHVLQLLEQELGISFTDKSIVIFEKDGKPLPLVFSKIKQAIEQDIVNVDTFFYNTLVSNKGEFQTHFKLKVSDGWVKKFLPTTIFIKD